VDQAIEVEEDRVVCIRFGHDWDPQCMVMDETLYGVQAKLQNFAVIYLGKLRQELLTRLLDSLTFTTCCSRHHESAGFQQGKQGLLFYI
jgi:hypothetical protein